MILYIAHTQISRYTEDNRDKIADFDYPGISDIIPDILETLSTVFKTWAGKLK